MKQAIGASVNAAKKARLIPTALEPGLPTRQQQHPKPEHGTGNVEYAATRRKGLFRRQAGKKVQ